MQNLLRAAAEALANLSEKAYRWADWTDEPGPGSAADETEYQFAGVDIVGIDFSTSIRQIATHVIEGWDRYGRQVDALRPNHGVWAFGVNAIPFPLTRRAVPPLMLPSLHSGHFQKRGHGRGLIEYGSAFYDYFLIAIGHVQQLGVFNDGRPAMPVTISLLCDGFPNGGTYRASDVQPLVEQARERGVRFKLVAIMQPAYRSAMAAFRDSLGLTQVEVEVVWYEEDVPDAQTISTGFESLSCFLR